MVVVNPSYVFGAPVDRSQPGETSTRMIGNYLRGRLPAVVDAQTNVVDVRDVAAGHLLAAERGRPGERYVLGGHDLGWVELIERVGELSGVHHPLVVLPPEAGAARRPRRSACRAGGGRGDLADGAELALLVGQGAARARLPGALARPHAARHDRLVPGADRRRPLRPPSPMSLAATGVRLAGRAGLLERRCELAERYTGSAAGDRAP